MNFVCHGNICRSPMAEYIFKYLTQMQGVGQLFQIESSGVSDEERGHPIYPPAYRCLRRHDIPVDLSRTARLITAADYDRYDFIICMDRQNMHWMKRIFPADPMNKIHMLMSFTGSTADVTDPWYSNDFERAYRDIYSACKALLTELPRIRQQRMTEAQKLNAHNKEEYPPAHTCEHLLNAVMVRMFHCGRAVEAHIERRKSKCDYLLRTCPTDDQIAQIEAVVNDLIARHLPVTEQYVSRQEAAALVDLNRLPADASQTLRLVRIGTADVCACLGRHVTDTAEIGAFRILSHGFANGVWRVRWKVTPPSEQSGR